MIISTKVPIWQKLPENLIKASNGILELQKDTLR